MEGSGRFHRFFHRTDALLNRGGQVVVDAAKVTPGLGLATCVVAASYHFSHSVHDFLVRGDLHEAVVQGTESAWYGVNIVPVVHHTLRIGHFAILGYDLITLVRRRRGSEHASYLMAGVGEVVAGFIARSREEQEEPVPVPAMAVAD
jgi:hypothetical protein